MSRFAIQWNRTTQTWWVTDNEADLAPVAEYETLLEAENYCSERGSRSER